MAKDAKYTADDIQDLNDRSHVRMRTQIYLGNTHPATYKIPLLMSDEFKIKEVEFIPAVYKAIGEVVDNALDEFSHITTKNKILRIDAKPNSGWYSVADNGRGIPIEQKLDRDGVKTWVPELVLSRLRSGRNFKDDKEVGVIGQNGVGSSCTNYCSSEFNVTIQRDGKQYNQQFVDGASKVHKPKIAPHTGTSGTTVSFQLDPLVFKTVTIPDELMENRAVEIAMTNPDVTVEYNGVKHRYKKGLHDVVARLANGKTYHCFEINEANIIGEIFVVLDAHNELDEQMYTWVNSSLLFDGGKCNTQFFNAFFDRVITHLEKEAKKQKAEVTRNDVRRGLLVLANLKVKNPEYDSQAKTRLTGPDLRKDLVGSLDAQWKVFAKNSSIWLAEVLEYATDRHHKNADADAIDEHEKKKKLKKKVDGLLDATGRDRSSCCLLVTEGESASAGCCEVRDPSTIGAFALTGKINNVYGTTPAQLLKMGKITDLLSAIGLTPGKKAIRNDLRYGRIYITTDSDYDGDNIMTLLVNLFYQHWPELFNPNYEPFIFRLTAPNVVASKNGKRIHFVTRNDYEAVKSKYVGWSIEYLKGLGSMNKTDWETVLSNPELLIPIISDAHFSDTLTLLFSPDSDRRKQWLQQVL
jgi:DNA gyrase/topoisomerase IV subunit B